jgi:hypothetical protein
LYYKYLTLKTNDFIFFPFLKEAAPQNGAAFFSFGDKSHGGFLIGFFSVNKNEL